MGASPASQAQQAAKGAAEQAYASQQRLIGDIQNKAGTYEQKTRDAMANLANITGTPIASYIPETRKSFEEYTKALTSEYRPLLEQFDPRLLNSPSSTRLSASLQQSAGQFTDAMRKQGEESSARLYRTLVAPQAAFTSSSQNPAFNNLINPEFMQLARKPPTITSDVDSMKSLYTYNV